jgi:hypothetical protein
MTSYGLGAEKVVRMLEYANALIALSTLPGQENPIGGKEP